MGGVVATNTNDDVSLFFLSLKQWFFPVLLPASGTAIEIRYVDACCRGPSRGSEACHLHIWSVFFSKHGVGRIVVVTIFFPLPAIV